MSKVRLSDLSENRVVMPTNVSRYDRNRQRSVVFYGRVSTEHEAHFRRLKTKCSGMRTKRDIIPTGRC